MKLKLKHLIEDGGRGHLVRGFHYSKKFESLYVSVPKCGCSSIKQMIQTYEHVGSECTQPLAIKNIHRKECNKYALPGLQHKKIAGLRAAEFLQKLTDPAVFRFTFVRNPYARLASAYRDKMLGMKTIKKSVVSSIFPTLNHLSNVEKCNKDVSFSEFVDFVISHKDHSEMNTHWRPQASILFLDYINYDIIAKLEDSEIYWKKIYDAVYSHKMAYIPLSHRNKSRPTPTTKPIRTYTNELAEKVFEFYERDFNAFNYEKNSYLDY